MSGQNRRERAREYGRRNANRFQGHIGRKGKAPGSSFDTFRDIMGGAGYQLKRKHKQKGD